MVVKKAGAGPPPPLNLVSMKGTSNNNKLQPRTTRTATLRHQSFTSLMEGLRQDITRISLFSVEYFLEGIALLRNWYINPNEKSM